MSVQWKIIYFCGSRKDTTEFLADWNSGRVQFSQEQVAWMDQIVAQPSHAPLKCWKSSIQFWLFRRKISSGSPRSLLWSGNSAIPTPYLLKGALTPGPIWWRPLWWDGLELVYTGHEWVVLVVVASPDTCLLQFTQEMPLLVGLLTFLESASFFPCFVSFLDSTRASSMLLC